MAASPSDTTTVLNPGVGGDTMSESQVPRVDQSSPSTGVSWVKEPRTVATDDDGRPLAKPLTETTGQLMLAMLSAINDKLALLSGSLS